MVCAGLNPLHLEKELEDERLLQLSYIHLSMGDVTAEPLHWSIRLTE